MRQHQLLRAGAPTSLEQLSPKEICCTREKFSPFARCIWPQ
ncbi:MAG TPA: hypothetical protein DCY36_08885 [Acidimicrobiaceae bacterium]|nr:hypothetical protein [Acidimicrobiaceae bacterium]